MTNLTKVKSGTECRITWMIGQLAEELKEFCGIEEDDIVTVVQHSRDGSAIVDCNGHRFAMDADTAFTIKVSVV